MAKLRVKKKSPGSRPPKAAVEPGNKRVPLMILLAGVAILVLLEINFMVQRAIRQNKRPEFVAVLPKTFQGLTAMVQYGNFLYCIDNTAGIVNKINKHDGKVEKVFHLDEGVFAALEDSRGEIYILDRQNTLHEYTPGNQLKRKIKLDGHILTWMEIDSRDNFYLVDGEACIITKYDSLFNKTANFGGKGMGRDNFINIGKVYAGPDNRLYCINMIEPFYAHIKVLDMDGKFIEEWAIRNMKKFSLLENLAITPDSHIYINSFEGSSIFVFDRKGNPLNNFDTDRQKRFLIVNPASMTGGKDGLLYVATHDIGIFRPIVY